MTNHLRLVDDTYVASRRIYVLALDLGDFASDVTTMEEQGYVVINGEEDRLIDEVDLRVHLQGLSVADDLMLPSIWWTSTTAHQLVTVAGWLGMKFINGLGGQIETVKAGR